MGALHIVEGNNSGNRIEGYADRPAEEPGACFFGDLAALGTHWRMHPAQLFSSA